MAGPAASHMLYDSLGGDSMLIRLLAAFSFALMATVSAANAATVSCGGDVMVTLNTSTAGTREQPQLAVACGPPHEVQHRPRVSAGEPFGFGHRRRLC